MDSASKSKGANIEPLIDTAIDEKSSFVKLAMRNMVKKGGTSLFHFALTIVGVLTALVGLAAIFH
jgi:p-aminobenzoyl-glutamate transporter AbgT